LATPHLGDSGRLTELEIRTLRSGRNYLVQTVSLYDGAESPQTRLRGAQGAQGARGAQAHQVRIVSAAGRMPDIDAG